MRSGGSRRGENEVCGSGRQRLPDPVPTRVAVQECKQTVKNKRLDATLADYLSLMIEAETTCLTATHSVSGVFKLKVTFELLDSESTDRG